jgi:hypothetical protein
MLRWIFVGVFALVSLGAHCSGPVGPVVNAVIDCTAENQDQINALLAEVQPLINGQTPDWAAAYQRAKQAGRAIGGCVLAELVQDYLGNKAAPPPQADSWSAFSALERFRREEAQNATFHTAKGDL